MISFHFTPVAQYREPLKQGTGRSCGENPHLTPRMGFNLPKILKVQGPRVLKVEKKDRTLEVGSSISCLRCATWPEKLQFAGVSACRKEEMETLQRLND